MASKGPTRAALSGLIRGDYLYVILLTVIVVAVTLPLYYYRTRLIGWFGEGAR